MCGIFAYLNYNVGRERRYILEVLFNGLRRLEYRGYDSAGISIDDSSLPAQAISNGSSFSGSLPPLVFRQEGNIESLVKSVYQGALLPEFRTISFVQLLVASFWLFVFLWRFLGKLLACMSCFWYVRRNSCISQWLVQWDRTNLSRAISGRERERNFQKHVELVKFARARIERRSAERGLSGNVKGFYWRITWLRPRLLFLKYLFFVLLD